MENFSLIVEAVYTAFFERAVHREDVVEDLDLVDYVHLF